MRNSWSFPRRTWDSSPSRRVRPLLEVLEDRAVPSLLVVTSLGDTIAADGQVTLREALTAANTNAPAGDAFAGEAAPKVDMIVFAVGLTGRTINLTSALPPITEAVSIVGPSSTTAGVIVSGQDTVRVFDVAAAANPVTLMNLTVTHGRSGMSANGGGIRNAGHLTLDRIVVSSSTGASGGGISNTGTLAVRNGSRITGNSTSAPSGAGGGIHNVNGTLTLTESTLAGNSAGGTGGGISTTASAAVTVTRSTLSGNLSGTSGGGIAVGGGTLNVRNSTIAHNATTSAGGTGGGLLIGSGTAVIVNSTVARNSDAGNQATGAGGIDRPAGALTLSNSIVALNTAAPATTHPDIDPAEINAGGGNFLGGDPRLGSLEDNGGPTFTLAPLSGSPVIDHGNNALATETGLAGGAALTVDQRNFFRTLDGNVDGTATVDQGAVEAFPSTTVAGVTVNPVGDLITTEAGGTASFTVALTSQPAADVTIALSSSDPTEGTAAPAALLFTPGNWSTPQTVTVTGVEDAEDDGDVPYTIIATATSTDPNYDGFPVADVAVTNRDDDVAGITVSLLASLITAEAGGTAGFGVVLTSRPAADVTIALASSDPTEGTATPTSLVFTPNDWDTFRIVIVTGLDDAVVDGDQVYQILLDPAASADPAYNGQDAPDVEVTNLDDDVPPDYVGVFAPKSGEQGYGRWYLRRGSDPAAPVTSFVFGLTGWTPLAGDWDGDGTDTPGVVDPSTATWYLRDGNDPVDSGVTAFAYGHSTWTPLAGDWDGDGVTTVGVVDATGAASPYALWHLRNGPGPGVPDVSYAFGLPGWVPVVGDWDGNGSTTAGMYDPSTGTWYLRNSNDPADGTVTSFRYGWAGWHPVAGDWDGDGVTTVGVVDSGGLWYLRNSNTPGAPDMAPFPFGLPGWTPLTGAWGGANALLGVVLPEADHSASLPWHAGSLLADNLAAGEQTVAVLDALFAGAAF